MIRVLIAEDMHMVRGALTALLSLESDIGVVAEVSDSDCALTSPRARRASALHLSVGTVCNYFTAVATKLNARNRVDAIRIAVEAGWL